MIAFPSESTLIWTVLGAVAEGIAAILALFALIYSIVTFRRTIKASHYAELDRMYLDILRIAIDKPHLRISGANRTKDQEAEYDAYAYMVWNFLESIHDRCLADQELCRTWYRSRLAEAYCASRCSPGVHVLSSGIGAGLNGDAPISPYAADILAKYALASYTAAHWQRTTAALLHASDVLVFMEKEHRRFCEGWIEPKRQWIEVWDVEDIGPMEISEIAKKVDHTFGIIRQRTDVLLATLGPRPPGADS
jgi:protein-tyrosine-phosphatase